MKIPSSMITGLILTCIGSLIVIIGAYLAYQCFQTYTPILPRAESLSEALTNTTYELVNLVLKLGFLGVMIWGGSVLLRYGAHIIIEVEKIKRV